MPDDKPKEIAINYSGAANLMLPYHRVDKFRGKASATNWEFKTQGGHWYVPPHRRSDFEPDYTDYLRNTDKGDFGGYAILQCLDGGAMPPGHLSLLVREDVNQVGFLRRGSISFGVVGGMIRSFNEHLKEAFGLSTAIVGAQAFESWANKVKFPRRTFLKAAGVGLLSLFLPNDSFTRDEAFFFDVAIGIPLTKAQVDVLLEDTEYYKRKARYQHREPFTDMGEPTSPLRYDIAAFPGTENCVSFTDDILKGIGIDMYGELDITKWKKAAMLQVPTHPKVIAHAIVDLMNKDPESRTELPRNTAISGLVEYEIGRGSMQGKRHFVYDRRERGVSPPDPSCLPVPQPGPAPRAR